MSDRAGRALFKISSLLCALTLAACQSLPTALPTAPAHLAADVFMLEGRVAVRNEAHQGSARLRWQHQKGERDLWTLSSPLGQILGRMTSTSAGAQCELADGQNWSDPNADRLLARLLGVEVPLVALPDWVQGVLRPTARVLETDALGRIQKISDAGWLISYQRYASDAPDALPRMMHFERGAAQLRLLIDQWQTHL